MDLPDDIKPKNAPTDAEYLGTVEWAWGPASSRIDSYYISRRPGVWFLWIRNDEFEGPLGVPGWELYAFAGRRGSNLKTSAIHLLADAWEADDRESSLGIFHLVSEPGLLSVAEFREIGRRVFDCDPEDGEFE